MFDIYTIQFSTFYEAIESGKQYYNEVFQEECKRGEWYRNIENVREKVAKLLNAEKYDDIEQVQLKYPILLLFYT